ncbi:ESX secretion-associated protein EspG [Nocardia sp. NPDC051750]|uniref:ESX secretion-associated protein EspG n=1 Tax=Nocardia sp. NPDC051750 TaxID=3364325 RepID=UPI0037B1A937
MTVVAPESGPADRNWEFTDLEYYVLWSGLDRGGLPFPFYYTARTQDPASFRADRARTRGELEQRLDTSFGPVLEAMAQPDVRIVVDGAGGRDPQDPAQLVRLSGVRRGDRGYVTRQLPGETCWHSGGFTVTECDALRLADTLVAAMPECAAGTLADIVLPDHRVDNEFECHHGGSRTRDWFTDSAEKRAAAFLSAPVERSGTVDIEQGYSVFGPRGIARYRIGWHDLEDDGRYVIDDQSPPVARAADRQRTVEAVNSKIAEVIESIKDERYRVNIG